ncbi:myosin-2 essential light chain-like [Lytechinus pictus]|uniref:myosin-2 essential light chain-like n=1 Tax=Lytechinus pictus TaxID=7653 RepID=UPI00240E8976|nr:myosin-2 essential light chain-like [Lytechinus pictus]
MSVSEETMSEMQECFNLFDKKGDGKIDPEQLGDVMRANGGNPTQAEVRKLLQEISSGHRITFEEFLPIMTATNKKREQGTQDEFIEGLKVFDKDSSGLVNSAELRHVLTSLGEKLTDEEVDSLVSVCEDTNGCVNYEEFVKMVYNR